MSNLKFIVGAVTAIASASVLVAACSTESATTQTTDASVEAGFLGCPPPFDTCNGQCFNLKKDVDNCSKCGAACKDGLVCVQGACAVACGGGTTKCGTTCVDTKVDTENCGGCGGKCAAGQVCSGGKCAPTCAQGYSVCGGDAGGTGPLRCADLQTNDTDCGQCSNACGAGYICRMGKCTSTCGPNLSKCPVDGGDQCVDSTNDPNNCGACGNKCKSNEYCAPQDGGLSKCALGCGPGSTACGQVCADTTIDPKNCGGCGISCNGGTCFNSKCCAGNTIYCGGSCINNQTDPNNCGSCSTKCATLSDGGAPTCNSGKCACATPSQGACVGSLCVAQMMSTPLTQGCDPAGCVTKVCAADSFCCSTNWDGACVNEVDTYCSPLKCQCP